MCTALLMRSLDGSGAVEAVIMNDAKSMNPGDYDMETLTSLHRVLDTGDLVLRFHDNRSIKAHSLKLKIASLDGVLNNLIEDVVDDQINAGAKRRRVSDQSVSNAVDLPSLRVSAILQSGLHSMKQLLYIFCDPRNGCLHTPLCLHGLVLSCIYPHLPYLSTLISAFYCTS